jgi:RNA polymerase sigma factor (sigma-70 family)
VTTLRVPTPALLVSLYREHERALRAFLRARVRDATVVEDLCQDTFLAALARGVPEGDCGPWLFAIARNKVLKYVRDRKLTAPLAPELVSRGEAPSLVAGEAEERERMRRAVAGLEEELREAVLLRYEGGLDAGRSAALLGVPVTTVESRLKRAREALVQTLASATPLRQEVAP